MSRKEKDETGLNKIGENVWGRFDLKREEEDFPSGPVVKNLPALGQGDSTCLGAAEPLQHNH